MYVGRLLRQLGFHSGETSITLEDNMSTREMLKRYINHNPELNYARQQVESNYLKIVHCPTEDMIADLITKSFANRST